MRRRDSEVGFKNRFSHIPRRLGLLSDELKKTSRWFNWASRILAFFHVIPSCFVIQGHELCLRPFANHSPTSHTKSWSRPAFSRFVSQDVVQECLFIGFRIPLQ